MFRPARVHELHAGPVKALDVAHGLLASGGADGVVRIVDDAGDHAGSYRHADLVNGVAIAPDRVASVARDHTVRVWHRASARSYVLGEHDHWAMTIAWSPDRHRLATGSEDGTIRIWEPEGARVRTISVGSPVNGVAWSPGVLAAVTGDRRLLLFDDEGRLQHEDRSAGQMLWSVALSPDGDRVAWTGRDRMLRLAAPGGAATAVAAHAAQVWSVTWSDTGRVITAGADGTVSLWTREGAATERITLPTWARRAVLAGFTVAVAGEDGTVRAFDDDGLPADLPPPARIPMYPDHCDHWDPQVEVAPVQRCEECGSVEELRLCVTCGHVGCCESQLAHGTKHWEATGHPITVPVAPGPIRWRWCYEDDMYVTRR